MLKQEAEKLAHDTRTQAEFLANQHDSSSANWQFTVGFYEEAQGLEDHPECTDWFALAVHAPGITSNRFGFGKRIEPTGVSHAGSVQKGPQDRWMWNKDKE